MKLEMKGDKADGGIRFEIYQSSFAFVWKRTLKKFKSNF